MPGCPSIVSTRSNVTNQHANKPAPNESQQCLKDLLRIASHISYCFSCLLLLGSVTIGFIPCVIFLQLHEHQWLLLTTATCIHSIRFLFTPFCLVDRLLKNLQLTTNINYPLKLLSPILIYNLSTSTLLLVLLLFPFVSLSNMSRGYCIRRIYMGKLT